jgi:hypothetical protein
VLLSGVLETDNLIILWTRLAGGSISQKSNKIQQKKCCYGTTIKTPYPTVLVGFIGFFVDMMSINYFDYLAVV